MGKFECPCGNDDKHKFLAHYMGFGTWHIRCTECHMVTDRFAPVSEKATAKEVIEWIESEDTK